MLTRMLKLASCSAGLLLGVSLATLSGCAGSDGGCTSCGRHSGARPYAMSPYPGVSDGSATVAPAAIGEHVPAATTPYANQTVAPYATAGQPNVPNSYPALAPAAVPSQMAGGSATPHGNPSTGPYGGQRTCPVTDEKLGSMGPAIPVAVKGETIFVCCEGCVKSVQRNPDAFIAKAMQERAGR